MLEMAPKKGGPNVSRTSVTSGTVGVKLAIMPSNRSFVAEGWGGILGGTSKTSRSERLLYLGMGRTIRKGTVPVPVPFWVPDRTASQR
jgi:hypothetical protein